MNERTLIFANMGQKKVRTFLLILSIFIAFLIFGLLFGFLDSYGRTSSAGGADERLIVTNRVNFTQPLPIAYLNRIKSVEGVAEVSYASWFGGFYKEPSNQIFTFGVEPETYLSIYKDLIVIPDDQKAAFIADRTGIVVGRSVADKFGWKLGDQIPLTSNIYSQANGAGSTWALTIRGIYRGAREEDPTSGAYIHWDYFDESRSFGKNNVNQFAIRTSDPSRNVAISAAVDASFKNSAAETATQSEEAFNQGFLAQLGDIVLIVRLVTMAAFVAILLIVGNSMVMAIRERTKEIGVMKTLGFSSSRVLRMVLGESLSIALIGAFLGLGAAKLLMVAVLTPAVKDFFGGLDLSWTLAAIGAAIAVAFGILTGLIPAINAFRLKIVDALGRK